MTQQRLVSRVVVREEDKMDLLKCEAANCSSKFQGTREEALDQGWRQSDNYHVSPSLKLIWLCPDCVKQLEATLTMQMRTVEYDATTAHERRVLHIQAEYARRLGNEQRAYARTMETIQTSYTEELRKLSRPPREEDAAEAAKE